MSKETFRGWEYARLGDYHVNVDQNWSYAPTYSLKMQYVHEWLDRLDPKASILDAGCGEGVLVQHYLARDRRIQGIDLNYESEFVLRGDVLAMPFDNESFDAVVMLDVFEHLQFQDQPRCLSEIRRVLKHGGALLLSVPNLAHLNSRIRMLFRGSLDRTDCEKNHPGERPIRENSALLMNHGFAIEHVKGITLTVPILYRRVICRAPSRTRWLHNWLNHFATPSLAMLNLFYCRSLWTDVEGHASEG